MNGSAKQANDERKARCFDSMNRGAFSFSGRIDLPMSLKAKLEAVVYAAEEPVTLAQLAAIFAEEVLQGLAEAALRSPRIRSASRGSRRRRPKSPEPVADAAAARRAEAERGCR